MIVEDQVLLRAGLERLFADGGHDVVASHGDASHLLATVAGHQPDLVVLDIRMPPTFTDEGARAAKAVKQAHPDIGVLVLSQHIETSHIVDLVTAVREEPFEPGPQEYLVFDDHDAHGSSAIRRVPAPRSLSIRSVPP